MSDYLVDTNIISEFSRSSVPPNSKVERWVESTHPDALFVSVLSLGEIRKGIELLPPGKKRRDLEQWLETDLNGWFGKNLLHVTKAIAERWGILAALSQQQGKPLGNIDGILAATALEHGLIVVTRNSKHFENLGVTLLNPWEN